MPTKDSQRANSTHNADHNASRYINHNSILKVVRDLIFQTSIFLIVQMSKYLRSLCGRRRRNLRIPCRIACRNCRSRRRFLLQVQNVLPRKGWRSSKHPCTNHTINHHMTMTLNLKKSKSQRYRFNPIRPFLFFR